MIPGFVLAKVIQRTLVMRKFHGMQKLLSILKNKFVKWVRDPSSKVPSSVALSKESITAVDIHFFTDAIIVASSEVVH